MSSDSDNTQVVSLYRMARGLLRHGVPVICGILVLIVWSVGLLFHPMLLTGAFIHRNALPTNTVCEPWQHDTPMGVERRRCTNHSIYYTTTIVQHRRTRADNTQRVLCEDFSFEFHGVTALIIFLGGLLVWAGGYYLWLHILDWAEYHISRRHFTI